MVKADRYREMKRPIREVESVCETDVDVGARAGVGRTIAGMIAFVCGEGGIEAARCRDRLLARGFEKFSAKRTTCSPVRVSSDVSR